MSAASCDSIAGDSCKELWRVHNKLRAALSVAMSGAMSDDVFAVKSVFGTILTRSESICLLGAPMSHQ